MAARRVRRRRNSRSDLIASCLLIWRSAESSGRRAARGAIQSIMQMRECTVHAGQDAVTTWLVVSTTTTDSRREGFHTDVQSHHMFKVMSTVMRCQPRLARFICYCPIPWRYYITFPVKDASFAYINCILSYNSIHNFISDDNVG